MFCIQQQKPLIRGSIEHGTTPTMEWYCVPYWGHHPTRLAAMRRYVEEMNPGFTNAPDSLIRSQWNRWARSLGLRTARAAAEGGP